MSILVTGSSGFIGFHVAETLLKQGISVIGFDNENDYYDVTLKQSRRNILEQYDNFVFYKGSLEKQNELEQVFNDHNIEKVIHLAAQAGVRYSLENPHAYIQSNLVGFHNIIDLAKEHNIKHLVYASSSSVYGNNEKQPFSVTDSVDSPISLYAASKKSNELIAHTYSHLFKLSTTGLRFFTVYGPRGRPDMAMFKFAKRMIAGETIDVYNHGDMSRDFTYIDDIVQGILLALDHPNHYQIFNLGNDKPDTLEALIDTLEHHLGVQAKKNYMPMQPGDVQRTRASIDTTREALGREPQTTLDDGVKKFIKWYKYFYEK